MQLHNFSGNQKLFQKLGIYEQERDRRKKLRYKTHKPSVWMLMNSGSQKDPTGQASFEVPREMKCGLGVADFKESWLVLFEVTSDCIFIKDIY